MAFFGACRLAGQGIGLRPSVHVPGLAYISRFRMDWAHYVWLSRSMANVTREKVMSCSVLKQSVRLRDFPLLFDQKWVA